MAAQILDKNTAWTLILEALNRSNVTLPLPGSDTPALKLGGDGDWQLCMSASAEAKSLLSVFLPLCCPLSRGAPSRVIGQMGQSLDGRIATVTGASKFINGEDGLTHLHRIRAVSEAVVVGAGTAATDNPRLTVRKAPGANPVRVVIDRHRRVPDDHHLFSDEAAPTLRLVAGAYQAGHKLIPR
ncbi:MAG: RibD family protein, partial [Marinobacter sp.]